MIVSTNEDTKTYILLKAKKNIAKLIKKKIVDKRNRLTTVYVKPIGESILEKIVNFLRIDKTAVDTEIMTGFKKYPDKINYSNYRNHFK